MRLKVRSEGLSPAARASKKERLKTLRGACAVLRPVRQKRVTDFGKHNVGTAPDSVARAPREARRDAGSGILESLDVASKASRARQVQSPSGASTAITILHRRGDVVVIKPDSRLYSHALFFAELLEDIKEEETFRRRSGAKRLKMGKSVTPAKPRIRYFETVDDDDAGNAEAAVQSGEVLYRYHSEDTVNVCAIYSSVMYNNAVYSTAQECEGRLQSFTVPVDRIREYVELINKRSKPASQAKMTGIRADDESSSDDDDEGGESSRNRHDDSDGDGGGSSHEDDSDLDDAVTPTAASSRGRKVQLYNYATLNAKGVQKREDCQPAKRR
jgi:hypothetical protein